MRWNGNLLCLIGIGLSLIPLFISWVTIDGRALYCIDYAFDEATQLSDDFSILDVLLEKVQSTDSCPCLMLSSCLFLAGTLVALVTPLGSLAQGVGIGILYFGSPFEVTPGTYCFFDANPGIGGIVAIVSFAFILAGVALPMSVTVSKGIQRTENRIWTWAKKE